MAGPVHWGCQHHNPRHTAMLRTASLYPLSRACKRRRPSVPGRLRRDLALWVKGVILAHNGGQDSTAVALERHGRYETLRRELREWTYDDADRIVSWGPGTEVDVAAGFPERLRWVLAWWTPEAAGPEPPLMLVCDPTHQRDAWVALVVSVAYRAHALPVAWHVVKADASESWIAHFRRLLHLLAPAVPAGMPVHVLCDRGLDSRDLWARIRELGWHPVLRYAAHITFRPTGGDRVPVRVLGGGPGTLWLGAGEACGRDPLPGTLMVLHDPDCEEPWVLLTDTPPDQTEAALYACRHGIEQGFRGLQRGGWPWGRTRRTDPVRVARHLLVLAVATRLSVAYGTRHEQARARGLPPGRLRRPPTDTQPRLPAPRRFSVLRQGAAGLRRLLVRNRLWARVGLTPTAGPDRAAGRHCLSPPAA